MISIIDYEAGNLRSVAKVFEKAGATPLVTCDKDIIFKSDAVVLPGVGAFSDCMASLIEKGMDSVVKACIEMGKPFLGICLGYQMLFEYSEEHSEWSQLVKGMGIFKGTVRKFPCDMGLKVPHMGWNNLSFTGNSGIFEGISQKAYVYFVHSYYVDPEDKSLIAAYTDYGLPFAAAIETGRVFGMQFHPEKSGEIGHKIISNFLKVVRK